MQKYVEYSDKDYEFKFADVVYEINEETPLIEVKRAELIDSLYNNFKVAMLSSIPETAFEHKGRPAEHKLETLFSEWMFTLYSLGYRYEDAIIPSVTNQTELPRNVLKEMLGFIKNQRVNDSLIDRIIEKLDYTEYLPTLMEKLRKYIRSDQYKTQISQHNVGKYDIENDYVLLHITNPKLIVESKYYCIIHKEVYKKLSFKYGSYGKYKGSLDNLIWSILFRYKILNSHNDQLAVMPTIKNCLRKKHKVDVELFGSAINHHYSRFCSVFYDLEKYFGSLGSYYDFIPIKGVYTSNPPFNEHLMEKASRLMIKHLNDNNKGLVFIYTIPIWDTDGKNKINQQQKVYIKGRDQFEDLDYMALKVLEDAGCITDKKMFALRDMPYLNYSTMKPSYATNTYFLTVQNTDKTNIVIENCYVI